MDKIQFTGIPCRRISLDFAEEFSVSFDCTRNDYDEKKDKTLSIPMFIIVFDRNKCARNWVVDVDHVVTQTCNLRFMSAPKARKDFFLQ